MPTPSFADVSAASRNALLAAKVSKALTRVRKGTDLTPIDKSAIVRGAELLAEILQGSLLFSRRTLEQGVTPDLTAYRYALSALSLFPESGSKDSARHSPDVVKVFNTYREQLSALAQGKQPRSDALDSLTTFFGLLGDLFFRDIQNPPPVTHDLILDPKHISA